MEEVGQDCPEENAGKEKAFNVSADFLLTLSENLFTRRKDYTTAFAGRYRHHRYRSYLLGISGIQNYIDENSEDTLCLSADYRKDSYRPFRYHGDLMNLENSETDHEKDGVYKSPLYEIVNAFNDKEGSENDLRSFKAYLEEQQADEESELSKALNGIQYTYDYDMLVYTKNVDGDIIRSDAQELMTELIAETMNVDTSMMSSMGDSGMMGGGMFGSSSAGLWQEMLSGDDGKPINELLEKQYDVIYGSWPNSANEIVLVLDENNELNDMALYALGLESREDINTIMSAAMKGDTTVEFKQQRWSYEDICNMDYRVVFNSDCYSYDESTGLYKDLRESDAGLQYLYDNAYQLKVSGIIRPSEDATAAMLTGSIGYTEELTHYIIEHSGDVRLYRHSSITLKEMLSADFLSPLPVSHGLRESRSLPYLCRFT